MLNDLKFVQGAVAKKDYVPALQFFRITEGRIYGYNGVIAISTPTDLDVDCTPKAVPFIKAVQSTPEGKQVLLDLTKAGRLRVRAGNFRVNVECQDAADDYPDVLPKGDIYPFPGGILPVLRDLAPFMGIDASRPWAMGILLKGQSGFATNNIVLMERWLPMAFSTPLNIPAEAIREMLRINKEPVSVQMDERSLTFHYENGAWLKTLLVSIEWPDVTPILDRQPNMKPIPEGFFEGVDRLAAFTDKTGRLHINGGLLSTHNEAGEGAEVELPDFGGRGCYHLTEMAKLGAVAQQMDLDMYPAPVLFYGDMLRGAIVGMRATDAV